MKLIMSKRHKRRRRPVPDAPPKALMSRKRQILEGVIVLGLVLVLIALWGIDWRLSCGVFGSFLMYLAWKELPHAD